jgi:hypothetical protein
VPATRAIVAAVIPDRLTSHYIFSPFRFAIVAAVIPGNESENHPNDRPMGNPRNPETVRRWEG